MIINGKRINRNTRKIVLATSTAIFSLVTAFSATIAWFATNSSATATGMQVAVVSNGTGAVLGEINLIKFDYAPDELGGFNYLEPQKGSVNEYYYKSDYNNNAGAFGYDDNNSNFVPVDAVMNAYDPADRIIRGGNLLGMNCNVVYEVNFSSVTSGTFLQINSNRPTPNLTVRSNEMLLSDCADFDVYYDYLLKINSSYSLRAAYSTNDLIIHNGLFYKAKVAIAASESDRAWDSSKWDLVESYSTTSAYAQNDVINHNGLLYKAKTALAAPSENNIRPWSNTDWDLVDNYSNTTYSEDAFIIHDGSFYLCATSIESAEDWNSTHWNLIPSRELYYPSYISSSVDLFTTNYPSDVYYKISYLSSISASHHCFYTNTPKLVTIPLETDKQINVSNLAVYINVNYSPTVVDAKVKNVSNKITTVSDFIFTFDFTENPQGGLGD